MQFILFDPDYIQQLNPLTLTRAAALLRVGGFTIKEKWEQTLNSKVEVLTRIYLKALYSFEYVEGEKTFINGTVCPTPNLLDEIENLPNDVALIQDGKLIAFKSSKGLSRKELFSLKAKIKTSKSSFDLVEYPWQIFKLAGKQIESDLELFRLRDLRNAQVYEQNTVFGHELYVEKTAKAQGVIFNTDTGPIYIGKDAEVMEGSVIRGPFFLGEHSTVKLAAKIYGPTVIGPHSKVGGEISNSVVFGYSNKGHDGFMGNSVLGEWCNLGADTNTSNLKNNYSKVSVFNYADNQMRLTEEQFCGLIMGDHSKTGINTMLNTGTVVGVSANIFGGDFPPKHVPSFYWGGTQGVPFNLDKAFEVAEKMMARRNVSFSDIDRQILSYIFEKYGYKG